MGYLNHALVLSLAASLLLCSCSASRQLSASRNKIPADSLVTVLEQNRIQYEWFSAKARINYEDQSISKSFTASIRMRRDSVIWISVTTMLGIEAARLLIRNDSVFFIDRLNKAYDEAPLSYLEQYISFPLNITLLQKILIGGGILQVADAAKVKQEREQYELSSGNNQYKYIARVDAQNLTMSTEQLTDIQTDRSISLVFDEYLSESDRLFSYARKISVKADGQIELSLKFSKVKWNEPLSFPFQVGEKYD